jgi:HK97 gp10 family phage protein
MSVQIAVEGMDEIKAKLKKLSAEVRTKALRMALRRGAAPVLRAARDKAPRRVSTGKQRTKGTPLHAAMEIKGARKRDGHDELSLKVGPNARKAPHAYLVEFGTGVRTQKSGKNAGTMPAQPFMRPAFDGTKDESLRVMRDSLSRDIERAASA